MMNLGLNTVNTNKWAGIDVAAVNQVSADIFKRAQNPQVEALAQAIKKPELGVDLYSAKTSVEAQKQIALFNQQAVSTQAAQNLNALAAATLYAPSNLTKAVEGKMTAAVAEGQVESVKSVFSFGTTIETFATSKDKKGSNPFAGFMKSNPQEDNKEVEGLSILA